MSTTIQGVSRVGAQEFRYETLNEAQVKARIQLFTGDQVENARPSAVGDQPMNLPTTEPAQRAAMATVFKNATAAQQANLVEAGNQLYQGLLASSSSGLTTGIPDQVNGPLTYAFEQYATTQAEPVMEDACNGVIYMALGGAESDLYDIAAELQGNIDNKNSLRSELTEAKEDLADFRGQLADKEGDGPWTFEVRDENGKYVEKSMTRTQAEAYQGALEKKVTDIENNYQNASDLTPMLQMRVQEAQQKYMQAMQMLSNMIKNWHDTAKAIIQNMRG